MGLARAARLLLCCVAPVALAACNAGPPSAAATQDCGRTCIVALTQLYVDAFLNNESNGLPLASGFRLTENLQAPPQGNGLWAGRVSAPASVQIVIPDPTGEQAGWLGVVRMDGKPAMLALRLRIHDRQIVEAEHLYAPLNDAEAARMLGMQATMAQPIAPAARKAHRELQRIGGSYYSALDGNDGSLAPFAADCQRFENGGVALARPDASEFALARFRDFIASDCRGQIDSQAFVYIDRIDGRRITAADPETGLVMGFSRFHHTMANLPYKVTLSDGRLIEVDRQALPFPPFDLASAHVFKIGPDGTITTIAALGVMIQPGVPDAWN